MKKSKNVPATLVISIAAAVVATGCGCNASQVRRCVDSTGRVLPDSMCTGPAPSGSYTYTTGGGYGNSYYSRPHWIYGGTYGSGRVTGGNLAPSGGADVVDGSGHTISRGGFGGGSGGGS